MSYIERETALNVIADIMSDCKVVHKHRALNRNIKQIPTADVVEARHGKWYKHDKKKHGDTCYHCSVCENYALSDCMVWELTDYCPHCGAKMDGERKENGT